MSNTPFGGMLMFFYQNKDARGNALKTHYTIRREVAGRDFANMLVVALDELRSIARRENIVVVAAEVCEWPEPADRPTQRHTFQPSFWLAT